MIIVYIKYTITPVKITYKNQNNDCCPNRTHVFLLEKLPF